MNDNLDKLINEWKERIKSGQKAHLYVSDKYNGYHYAIGLPATILTTIAGATLFAEVKDPRITMAVGVVGLLAALLSAVQTFYSHAKRGEQHRTVAAQLGNIKREIEIFEKFTPEDIKEQETRIRQISDELTKIESDAPVVKKISEEKASRIIVLSK
jgi:hypothetical protein